jgi:hypothetical protein
MSCLFTSFLGGGAPAYEQARRAIQLAFAVRSLAAAHNFSPAAPAWEAIGRVGLPSSVHADELALDNSPRIIYSIAVLLIEGRFHETS